MKKELAKYFSQYQDIDCNRRDPVEVEEVEVTESDLDRIFKEIFSVDPNSGLPRGDIAYYLSADGNPQVKQWLENNLLRPRVTSKRNMEGVTDDLLVEMSRQSGESIQAYSERLMSIYDESVQLIEKFKES